MAGHGGPRPGAGRKPGKVSKAKLDIAERAKTHGDAALRTLAEIMTDPEAPHSARVSAANAVLDRGYGRPHQAVELTGKDGGPVQTLDLSRLSDAALAEMLAVADEQKDDISGN